ncbi:MULTISPECIES: DEAD/DEAH box helicase [Bifidobacterium]|uniref:DEAD/DEAH box helicase n=1 Tax=Bifidobacterium asteroides TaxID=1684 RepID=A0A556RC40_9BIFI|nr:MULTISPECIES: DEAD/DEAH box helicase [Bifidobacterium]MBI0086104.1 DEAD/DEAH box helicase [Bifidobacterium sp. M0404]TSJ86448.1 DEAD/DEAH box helicase [Bifidobacterium polysaccharolyticum]
MVDFNQLGYEAAKSEPIDPLDIFERLVKPQGINDLYNSQHEVLNNWYQKMKDIKDVVVKLHTGGGKTLVGLLIGLSSMRELHKPVLYLTPTHQLAEQTFEQAQRIGIPAVLYEKGVPLVPDFLNGNAIMVGTYNCLFNAKSKFGVNGSAKFQELGAILLDDAHASFPIIRDCFTLEVSSKNNKDLYEALTDLFKYSFIRIHREEAYEDILAGRDSGVLEVPYWAWHEKSSNIAELIRQQSNMIGSDFTFSWPLLRDNLNLCHALISSTSFTITSMLPLVKLFPAFVNADRRIYMSANINDTNEIIRTFGATPELIPTPESSKTLVGVSEKMILIPEKMPFYPQTQEDVQNIFSQMMELVRTAKLGTIILVPSNRVAEEWADYAYVANGSEQVEEYVKELQSKLNYGPFVFANRYDGVDLPGNACRLLIMSGLPEGSSNYDKFKATALRGSESITREIAQKIEQGIGRGARGASDYCVVFLVGRDLVNWVSITKNTAYLTNITRAQLEIASQVSESVSSYEDLIDTVRKCLTRDKTWTEFYRKTLSNNLTDDYETAQVEEALLERTVIDLWQEGYKDKAIDKLNNYFKKGHTITDPPMRGWLEQLSSKIYYDNNNYIASEQMQKRAFGHNKNLTRPSEYTDYPSLPAPDGQAKAIVENLSKYSSVNDAIRKFESIADSLVLHAPPKKFEQALCDFAYFLGFKPERHDINGEGSDVIWLTPSKVGFIMEAKNNKNNDVPLHKKEAGQLNVAKNWFNREYTHYRGIPVSVHPSDLADKNAEAQVLKLLSLKDLRRLISETYNFLLQFETYRIDQYETNCELLLEQSKLRPEDIERYFLSNFKTVEH